MARDPVDPDHSTPATTNLSPTALLHAKALVESHGIGRARDIARVNALLDSDDPYWRNVLQAIGDLASSPRGDLVATVSFRRR